MRIFPLIIRVLGAFLERLPLASAREDMTLERLTQDAVEIAEFVQDLLDQEKLVLVGQSWGSMIGWTAALRRPDLFHAYVGTGQAVSWFVPAPLYTTTSSTNSRKLYRELMV
jgi:pimeloyl-ACP methyl ester carboxylesterase